MDEIEVKGFTFYRSYFEAARDLPSKEEQADFLMAVCSYVFEGKEPDITGVASAMFKLAKPNLETSIKRSKAGAKLPKDEQNIIKQESNQNQIEIKTESNTEQTEIKKHKAKKEKPIKHRHGEYGNVLLSDVEFQKLKDEFPNDWKERIENMSEYCASHGKSYRDYLATIRNWARRDKETKPMQSPHGKNDIQAGIALMDSFLGENDG